MLTNGGLFIRTCFYQVMAFQITLSLGIYISYILIWINWIFPTQIPSQLISLVLILGLREADRWGLTPTRSKRAHSNTDTLWNSTSIRWYLSLLISIFCWHCKASMTATSSFSPSPTAFAPAQQQTYPDQDEVCSAIALSAQLWFLPFFYTPSLFPFFIINSQS